MTTNDTMIPKLPEDRQDKLHKSVQKEVENINNVFIFDNVSSFYKGYATVSIDNKWGIINKQGEFIVKPQYIEIDYLSEDSEQISFVLKKDNKKFVVADTKGNLSGEFDEIHTNSSTLYPVRIDKNWGAINYKGEVIIPFGKFDCIYNFWTTDKKETFGVVSDGLNIGLIDTDGKFIIDYDCEYEDLMWVDNDTIITKKVDKFGVIDRHNNVLVPFVYDYIDFLKEGFRFVQQGDEYGYIDEYGNLLEVNYDQL